MVWVVVEDIEHVIHLPGLLLIVQVGVIVALLKVLLKLLGILVRITFLTAYIVNLFKELNFLRLLALFGLRALVLEHLRPVKINLAVVT